jgi:polyhydroxyalkanoate synthesis regulator phasin
MTRIETSRVNEVIGLHIGTVQEAAHKLNAGSDLQELESDISALEKTIADLKDSMAALPYKH